MRSETTFQAHNSDQPITTPRDGLATLVPGLMESGEVYRFPLGDDWLAATRWSDGSLDLYTTSDPRHPRLAYLLVGILLPLLLWGLVLGQTLRP